jgi:hypothetical protein
VALRAVPHRRGKRADPGKMLTSWRFLTEFAIASRIFCAFSSASSAISSKTVELAIET